MALTLAPAPPPDADEDAPDWHDLARPEQLPPPGDWSTWLILGGRGSGKTRAGAEWVRAQAESGASRRIALIGETADQVRDVMVRGESGLLSIASDDQRPEFLSSLRYLRWPSGSEAWLFSACDPESLRGPQFDAAWCDELAKWRRTEDAWTMLQFGLRLGERPRAVVTTTPRPNPTLIALMDDPATARVTMPTADNAANLAPGFVEHMQRLYKGSAIGRQELLGELVMEMPDSLWTRERIETHRIGAAAELDRIVVAVDPPVTARRSSDACGIVVAGSRGDHAVVLADWSVQGASPQGWARRAVAAYHAHKADRLIAEVNQGGDMVETIVRQIDPDIAYRPVRATRGKVLRAEPVGALYELGRVHHTTDESLAALEDEMCAFGPNVPDFGRRSPDRVDALVWAITDLLLQRSGGAPRVRAL